MFFLSCDNNSKEISRGYSVKVGDKAPKIDLELLNGQLLTNENLKGKVVVIQFTASWCSVCIKEMPHLEKEVWQRFKNDDFMLIGVDLKEELNVVQEFIQSMSLILKQWIKRNYLIISKSIAINLKINWKTPKD